MKKSTYIATFRDGSVKTEAHSWAEMATEKFVKRFDGSSQRVAAMGGVRTFRVKHREMEVTLDVPQDVEVYQATREEIVFLPNGQKVERTRGHVVGLVRDGRIVEERFMNAMDGRVYGARK